MTALTTASNQIAIGKNINTTKTAPTSLNIAMGNNITSTTGTGTLINTYVFGQNIHSIHSHEVVFGTGGTGAHQARMDMRTAGNQFSSSSDVRIKKNIQDYTLGLEFINKIRPVSFQMRGADEIDWDDAELADELDYKAMEDNVDTTLRCHGFIAQEIKEAMDTTDVPDAESFRGYSDSQKIKAVAQGAFIIPLVKAVQELSEQVTELKAEITRLKKPATRKKRG